ncbi:UNVERIFIED_CONTAM: hypothetical protein GTU68_037961 [Idotea baltica]|nr:hypothetical protein [Idotea baltica]
MCSDINLPSDP